MHKVQYSEFTWMYIAYNDTSTNPEAYIQYMVACILYIYISDRCINYVVRASGECKSDTYTFLGG
jgi:hypothetical protein